MELLYYAFLKFEGGKILPKNGLTAPASSP